MGAEVSLDPREHVSLCEALDRVLNKGVVVAGDVVISVADVDLIYLGVQLVLTSVETADRLSSVSPSKLGGRYRGGAAVRDTGATL